MKRYISVAAWVVVVAYLLIHHIIVSREAFFSAAGMAVHTEFVVAAPTAGNVRAMDKNLLDSVHEGDTVLEIIDPSYYRIEYRIRETALRDPDSSQETDDVVDISEYITPMTAPTSGSVIEVFVRPGEGVLPGQALMTIVRQETDHVLVYVASEDAAGLGTDTQVRVVSETGTVDGVISQVGSAVMEVPKRLAEAVRQPIWGVPIHVRLLEDGHLRHGQLVEVLFPSKRD
jgi:multidrug resistance efflux pump